MSQPRRPLSIAVIDADISSRSAVARLLLANGYPSGSFASVAAYDAHRTASVPADLVFIDAPIWLAPGTTARQRVFAGSVVVALGNEARIEQVGPAFAAGCFDYLVKPVAPALLRDVLAQAGGDVRGGPA